MKPTKAALIPLVFVDDTLATEPDQASGKSAHLEYMTLFHLNISSPQEWDLRHCILLVRSISYLHE